MKVLILLISLFCAGNASATYHVTCMSPTGTIIYDSIVFDVTPTKAATFIRTVDKDTADGSTYDTAFSSAIGCMITESTREMQKISDSW